MDTIIGGKLFRWKSETFVMGVINVTPDSFSGDGINFNIDLAVEKALEFEKLGCHILDIGGESTRPASIYPDARPVDVTEEIDRVLPIIEALIGEIHVPVSIDTRKAKVAEAAISAGAGLVNDVSMMKDPQMAAFLLKNDIPIMVSHIRPEGHTDDVVTDVIDDLGTVVKNLTEYGFDR